MARRRSRNPASGRGRTILVLGGGAVVLALAAVLALAPVLTNGVRPPTADGVRPTPGGPTVVISMAGFTPNRLTVRAGEPVTLTLRNPDSQFHTDGGGWHQFAIDALKLDVRVPPRSMQTVALGALAPGTYEFYCDICCGGRANPSMIGILEVTG